MPPFTQITIHSSQFPDRVQQDLIASLRRRKLNHKFLYDSLRQTRKWLALHEAYSPACTDPAGVRVYEDAAAAAAARAAPGAIQVIGLGCGGGEEDVRLLRRLREAGRKVFYSPVDVSAAMVLVARQAALREIPETHCRPLVCDLTAVEDLPGLLAQAAPPPAKGARLITFFGLLPNFQPGTVWPQVAALARPGDQLLLSANLAPGPDYAAGVQRILPLYDNPLTRDWLETCLLDLGFENADGRLEFTVEEQPDSRSKDFVGDLSGNPIDPIENLVEFGSRSTKFTTKFATKVRNASPQKPGSPAEVIKSITACFHLLRPRVLQVGPERFAFAAGDRLRVFFSCRHNASQVRKLLEQEGLYLRSQWVTPSEEEGVFLADRGNCPTVKSKCTPRRKIFE